MAESAKTITRTARRRLGLLQWLVPVLVLVAGFIYWPAVDAVLQSWDFDYDHGPVLLLVAGFLFYRRWPAIVAASRAPALIGLAGLLLAGGAWSLAYVASIQTVEMLLLPVIVAGIVLTMFGWRALWAAALPVGYLYFAMPVWGFLNPLLQALTVVATSEIMALISIPARISGNFVILPNGVFEIASGCSGLSYFISAGAIGVLYAGLYLDGFARRLAMISASLGLAVLANWIRVVLIIIAGYQTDMQHYLVAVDHYWFGWAIFGVFLVPMFWLGRRLEGPADADLGEGETALAAAPATRDRNPAWDAGVALAAAVAMIAAPLAVGAVGGGQSGFGSQQANLVSLKLPADVNGWQSASVVSGDWWPAFKNVPFSNSRSYQRGPLAIDAHWLVYPQQSQEAEVINAYNFYADRKAWRQVETWQAEVLQAGQVGIPVTEAIITAEGGARKRLAVAYYVAGELASSGISAKLAQIKGLLRGRKDAAVLLLGVNCQDDCPQAAAQQQQLLVELMTVMQTRIDELMRQPQKP